ncbi:putative duf234 dexx-box-containing atpase [Galbibacter marinus]|uniref:Putative duf234 dexx-box-containing atpase n=1 Tax=Galbibacter marinus TaxID=555500 RepID=K2QHZ2_9FLAO|nr:putative duf234 dexx-box-containing atpase [Galbibacter marinus]
MAWFRFIYKNRSAVEIGNFDFMEKMVTHGYTSINGSILEKYFIEKMKQEGNYSNIDLLEKR